MKHWDDCTPAQQIERWENVERVLKGLSPHERRKHWDMASWGYKTECGTVACAAGHCGTDPWFRRRGFKLRPTSVDVRYDDIAGGGFGEFDNFVEPQDFFGWTGTEDIFLNQKRRSVAQVIREVRAYIKKLRRDFSQTAAPAGEVRS